MVSWGKGGQGSTLEVRPSFNFPWDIETVTEDTPIYSSRIIKTYIDYLRKYYPDIAISELLDYAGGTVPEMEDGGHWFTRKQLDRFHEILIQKTYNPSISREVGRYTHSSKSFGFIRQDGMGFLNAPLAYSLMDKTKPLGH